MENQALVSDISGSFGFSFMGLSTIVISLCLHEYTSHSFDTVEEAVTLYSVG